MKLDEETKKILVELVRAVRSVAHGDFGPDSSGPGGLEALAMSLNGQAGHGKDVSGSLDKIAEALSGVIDCETVLAITASIDDVATANTKIADAINNLADAVREHGTAPERNLP